MVNLDIVHNNGVIEFIEKANGSIIIICFKIFHYIFSHDDINIGGLEK